MKFINVNYSHFFHDFLYSVGKFYKPFANNLYHFWDLVKKEYEPLEFLFCFFAPTKLNAGPGAQVSFTVQCLFHG